MRILIDIGHPAHVHYFKNLIKIMSGKDHQFLIFSRDKEVTFELLQNLGINYLSRGTGGGNMTRKFIYLVKTGYQIYKESRNFKPDLFLSFGSVYAAYASRLYGKPHIALDDTEHAKLDLLLYPPCTNYILTPSCFNKDLGKKQIRFNGYMELAYLHPKYFTPNEEIKNILGVRSDEKYILLRFVSWAASHDAGKDGLSNDEKIKIVRELDKYSRIFISSEGVLPIELLKYQIKIKPHQLHDALAFANLYIGEGATTVSECAMLGTPAIYVNPLSAGTLEEQQKYGLIYSFRDYHGVIDKAIEILKNDESMNNHKNLRDKMFKEKIDVTSFMVWFIENYPDSAKLMKEHPDYQVRFKNNEESINS